MIGRSILTLLLALVALTLGPVIGGVSGFFMGALVAVLLVRVQIQAARLKEVAREAEQARRVAESTRNSVQRDGREISEEPEESGEPEEPPPSWTPPEVLKRVISRTGPEPTAAGPAARDDPPAEPPEVSEPALAAPGPGPSRFPESFPWSDRGPRQDPSPSDESRPSVFPKIVAAARTWLTTGNAPVKVGVLVLLVGVGLLIRETSRRGVITLTIEARLIAIAIGAVVLLVLGWRHRARRPTYGRSLQGAGIGALYITTYASYEVYDLLAVGLAAAAVILITVLAGVLAVRQDAQVLAIFGIVGGFLAPVLAYRGTDDYIVVFSFYTVLSVAIVVVAWFKVWPSLNLLGLLFNIGISAFWLLFRYAEEDWPSLQPFIAVLVVIYMVVPLLAALRDPPRITGHWMAPLVFGTPFAGLWLQHLVIGHTARGVAASALVLAGLYVVLYAAARRLGDGAGELAEAYAGLAAAFGAIAVPLWLGAYYTTVAWAMQSLLLIWFGCRRSRLPAVAGGLLLQVLAGSAFAIHLTASLPYPADRLVILNDYFAAAVLLAATAIGSSRLLQRAGPSLRLGGLAGAALAWGAAWWLAGGLLEIAYQVPSWPLPVSFVFVVASCGAAVWLAERMRWRQLGASGFVVVPALGFVLLAWLLHGPYHLDQHGAAAVMAATGLVSGLLLHRSGRQYGLGPEVAWVALGWGAAWWLAGGLLEIAYQVPSWPLPVSFVFVVASCGAAVWLAERMRWRQLGASGFVVVPALGFVLLAWLLHGPYHLDQHGAAAVMAATGLVSGLLLHRSGRQYGLGPEVAWVALGWGAAWWLAGGLLEIAYRLPSWQLPMALGFVAASLGLAARAAERAHWPQLGTLGLLILPTLAVMLGLATVWTSHPLGRYGWAVWPLALAVYYWFLRFRDGVLGSWVAAALHVGGFWVVAALVGFEVHWQVGRVAGGVWQPVAALAAVLLLVGAALRASRQHLWPIGPLRRVYLAGGVGPVVLVLAAALLVANLLLDGDPSPFRFIPVFNPLEMLVAALVAVALQWRRAAAEVGEHRLRSLVDGRWAPTLASAGVVVATMSVARTIHHWRGEPWRFAELVRSTELQASLTIVWSAIALTTMVAGVRLVRRPVWIAGASFMALVLLKLFLVDLASLGAVTRVVSFLGVGTLLVVVGGYFAPVPPAAKEQATGDSVTSMGDRPDARAPDQAVAPPGTGGTPRSRNLPEND